MEGWKTVLVSFLLVVFGALEQTGIVSLVPAEYQGAALTVIGFVMFGLRALTKTPMVGLAPKDPEA